jgi:hypothetical protein
VNPFANWKESDVQAHNERVSGVIRGQVTGPPPPAPPRPQSKRIRQDSKPLLNKLEQEFYDRLTGILSLNNDKTLVRAQAKRYKIGNGVWYKPDFTASWWTCKGEEIDTTETAWEVKGPFAYRGGLEALKTAAHQWPEVAFYLVWKENGEWKEQRVLP